ncbi:N-acetylmuramic acid 6-phosphate etherase [Niveispirillum lacus]|uniref:N-acetylmuramic acid 6-phosphate etherase n=1 Tax=Niveispirillum lacus TaxID=1981099 RepID=A0A255Z8B7_9PROT|nr:N-acetylmuramic acid 6-phosphate etherase [Niveispirillum lacus]OYQ37797.1 N-acetylmuramic acid 6-phosphate etherase [Niveispirillum lacus]
MKTESISARYLDMDAWPTTDAVQAMLESQFDAVAAVRSQTQVLAAASDAAAARLGEVGRLIYVGAGTSGRLAVQDGVELGPTYNWPKERSVFALAGGMGALSASAEDAEDRAEQGEAVIRAAQVGPADVVIGLAASGTTPFTVAAVAVARAAGALTIGMANNSGTPLLRAAEYPICLETGGEFIAGSTRMKAGTAQKIAINILSTAIMVRLGRVYRGMMVDMRVSNEKLRDRGTRIVVEITGCALPAAAEALQQADGNIRIACLVAVGLPLADAQDQLTNAGGSLRDALSAAHRALSENGR